MPNGLSNLADSIVETGGNLGSNIARVATIRRRHSVQVGGLPVPPPPQRTNATTSTTNIHGSEVSLSSNTASRRTSQSTLTPDDSPVNCMTIEFEGGSHVVVRPNRTVRGRVILTVAERMLASRIRIKFRAEEIAQVRLSEGGDAKNDRIHHIITTFFDVQWKLWGNDATSYSFAGWDELKPNKYEFPFALRFPNVNYPPSTEEPRGFFVRYVWTAQVDGPALESGLKSPEYFTPYRPIIASSPDREWEFRTKLLKDKKNFVCNVLAKIPKQCYCPDEAFYMYLELELEQLDSRITSVSLKFRKRHEGRVRVQKGTAINESDRIVLERTLSVSGSENKFKEAIMFNIPTRLVSPSFKSHHTKVSYNILFDVTIEHGTLFKTTHSEDFSVPITIANLPYSHFLRVPELLAAKPYHDSKECPQFFDPTLDQAPEQLYCVNEVISSDPRQLPPRNSTPVEEPPSYFNIPTIPAYFENPKERKERTVFLTRITKYQDTNLTESTLLKGVFDDSW